MKERQYKQMIAVEGDNPSEVAKKFNQSMIELAIYKPTFQMVSANLFYIFYDENVEIPETLADEYRLRGEEKHCSDCPYFKPLLTRIGQVDKRARRGSCELKNRLAFCDGYACEEYYKKFAEE